MIESLLFATAVAQSPECSSLCGEERLYPAGIFETKDGDTFVANVDLGFELTKEITIRLKGVDTPENRGKDKDPIGSLLAEEFARKWIARTGGSVRVADYGYGAFRGRRIVAVYAPDSCESLAEALIEKGLGVVFK